MTNPSETIRFPGSSGIELAARIDLPNGVPRAYALFAHCFTCSKDSLAAYHISRELTAQGIAVLRFDFTGLGDSAGDFANTNFASNVEDLLSAAAYLRMRKTAPQILIGHSLGGTAVLAAAARIVEARAVASIAAPLQPAHVKSLLSRSTKSATADGGLAVTLGGRQFNLSPEFLRDLDRHDLRDALGKLGKALLILHSPYDDIVEIENATQIFLAAKHPKSFVSLDHADHLLTRKEDSVYVARVLAAWASRYIVSSEPLNASTDSQPGIVVVEESGDGKFAQTVTAGHHRLHADEPRAAGGNDSGPGPYDLLLAALGTCTAMTVRMYADLKDLPLQKIIVRLKHDKIYAQDCAECTTREGRIDRIEREIELQGPLAAEQRDKLLEIANRCPVHRTLHSEVLIPTRLKG